VICLVTDRHRLAERLGLEPDAEPVFTELVEIVDAAAKAGIDLVQVREADLNGQRLIAMVHQLLRRIQGTTTRVIVNDRLDLALAAGAHGVHFKDQPVSMSRIRAVTPDAFMIGKSIHSADRATEDGVDYFIFGTVFRTSSKPEGHAAPGLAGLAAAAERARVPVLGIGGVAVDRFAAMAAAGAAGFAAVELFLPSGLGRPARLREIAGKARQMFDSGRSSS
jgi:thiamine-phosphate diphosphorylase